MNYSDYYWLAEADYEDGSWISRRFEYKPERNDNDEQFRLEEWLLQHHDGCVWFSVILLPIEE